MVITIVEKAQPLHHSTCNTIRNLMQEIGYSNAELSLIEEFRKSIIKRFNPALTEPKEKIDCWIF